MPHRKNFTCMLNEGDNLNPKEVDGDFGLAYLFKADDEFILCVGVDGYGDGRDVGGSTMLTCRMSFKSDDSVNGVVGLNYKERMEARGRGKDWVGEEELYEFENNHEGGELEWKIDREEDHYENELDSSNEFEYDDNGSRNSNEFEYDDNGSRNGIEGEESDYDDEDDETYYDEDEHLITE
ncbi:uncharacterized protein [Euphorbia lathyris]|uniref:uncharacterized protein isoform X1 n=1 Tax=Euphorbia lathyris TaxID=212925 RepID=UPI003313DD64